MFAGTHVAAWLAEQGVDTITIVGFMTNNSRHRPRPPAAEELGLAAEVLSDATGAIHLANEAGKVSASRLHDSAADRAALQSNSRRRPATTERLGRRRRERSGPGEVLTPRHLRHAGSRRLRRPTNGFALGQDVRHAVSRTP